MTKYNENENRPLAAACWQLLAEGNSMRMHMCIIILQDFWAPPIFYSSYIFMQHQELRLKESIKHQVDALQVPCSKSFSENSLQNTCKRVNMSTRVF